MTILDTELKSKFLTVICDTIINSKNRNDFVVLMDELATECTAYTQNNLLSSKIDIDVAVARNIELDKSIISRTEKVAKTTARPVRERVNLAENLNIAKTGGIKTTTQKGLLVGDGIAKANDHVADAGKMVDPDQMTPVWLSESVNLEEYWVYDYSKPVVTKCGNCGCPCAQTELWLVHRRKYKLSLVDAEFASVDALRDFLDPRKELAAKNNIYPLEKIDAELADNEKEQHAKLHADKKQSQLNRFIEFYHQFNGDAAKISAAMGIQKQSVYAYKNKAKTMGVLK